MCLPVLAAIPAIVASVGSAIASAGAAVGAGVGAAAGAVGAGFGATAGALGLTTGQLAFGLGSLAISAASSGVSAKQGQEAAAAQAKSIEQQGVLESQKETIAIEQKRQASASEIEKLAIAGARDRGVAQASGLSPSQVARYARVARANTLRDISGVQRDFEFSSSSSLIDQNTIAANVRAQGRDVASRAPTKAGLGLDLLNTTTNFGLKIANSAAAQT